MKQSDFSGPDEDPGGFANYFRKCTNEELVEAFNLGVQDLAWLIGPVEFFRPLGREFLKRELDCSSFISDNYLNSTNEIRLVGNRIEILIPKVHYTLYDYLPN
jgi:hypothetical protein